MSRHDMSALACILNLETDFLELAVADQRLVSQLMLHGYQNLRLVNGRWCGTQRFIYTVGVVLGLDETGYTNRFCFDTEQNAALFLKDWDGSTLPVVGDDGCKAIK